MVTFELQVVGQADRQAENRHTDRHINTRALSQKVHYSVCQTSPIKSDRFKDLLFFYTGKTGYQKPPTSWSIQWLGLA